MYSDILFELGMEELPSCAVKTLGDALYSNIIVALNKHGIVSEFDNSSHAIESIITPCFATPRRIAVCFKVKTQQP